MDDKRFFLERLINEHPESKILVFVRTKIRAERVKAAMERVNIQSMTIHGDKDQSDRFNALTRFKKGEVKVLIATDVSARGIDIPNVEYVVNYDLPDKAEHYVHRIGRTGRAKLKGFAVSFCAPEEQEWLDAIEQLIGKPISEIDMSKNDYQDTLDFSEDVYSDWKTLLKEEEQNKKKKKTKKK